MKKAFTLVEILIGVFIFSIIMIGAFQSFGAVTAGKVHLTYKTNIHKQALFFSQKLFEAIKQGGTIDYEEYFNRKIVGMSTGSGYYKQNTGFGNFGRGGIVGSNSYGDGPYICLSGNSSISKMNGEGCIDDFNIGNINYNGSPQRYGQYKYHFIDYNSDYDNSGDEDGDGSVIGDADDKDLGKGPIAFPSETALKELYLISGDGKYRTFFRYKRIQDSHAPMVGSSYLNPCNTATGSGTCIGTIEFLRLEGKDYGYDHMLGTDDIGEYDGMIDTWLVHSDFIGSSNEIVAGSNNIDYWVSLFPENIHIQDFEIFLYPNEDISLAWKTIDKRSQIAPYLRINMEILPSWKIRKQLKTNPKPIVTSHVVSLMDIFSK